MRPARLVFKKCSWELGRLVRLGNSPGWTRPEHRRYVKSPPTPPTLGLGDEVAEWPAVAVLQATPRHTSDEFVAFLTSVVETQPRRREIHIIVDDLSAHKTQKVRTFLVAYPNVRLHYTPTYSSWLNQVELWFSKIERD